MKKPLFFLTIVFISSLKLIFPTSISAQACSGTVSDTEGNPIENVTVQITSGWSLCTTTNTYTTNASGYWQTPSEIIDLGGLCSISFSATDYDTIVTTIGVYTYYEACNSGTWTPYSPSSITLGEESSVELGWDCIAPGGTYPCGQNPVPGGEYTPDTEAALLLCESECDVLIPTINPNPTLPPIATPPMKCDPAGQPAGTGIDTAIGCIPFADNNAFVKFVLGWSIGIGGGISFLLSAASGFIMATSAGDPKKLAAGKELLMAALSGLLLLIFSVFVLRLFGFEILQIPGF